MTWFRVDDGVTFHRKTLAAGNEAFGVLVRMGAHASAQLSDGFVDDAASILIAGKRRVLERLVEVGFLTACDGGYEIHDFADYNPRSAEVRAKREALSEARRDAGRKGGSRSGEARAKQNEANAKQVASTSSKQTRTPVPSRPNPEEEPPTPLPGVAAIAVQKSTPTTRVFDHWRSAMGSPRSVLDKKRRKRIDWAIETYDEATCIQAIDGCRADPFSMGENDRGAKFNALELIFRDAEHVEKFREIGKAATAPPARDVDDLPPLVDPSKLPTPEQLRANLAALDEIRRSSPFAAKEAQSA